MTDMTLPRDAVAALILSTIDEINQDLGLKSLHDANENTPLFGGEAGVDSLSLAMLVAGVEQVINQSYGRDVLLASEKAMSMRNSPFRTVATLIDFAVGELARAAADD